MAGRTDGSSLTTIEVHGDTEQIGGSGRHREEEGNAGPARDNSRTVSARRYVRGDSSPGNGWSMKWVPLMNVLGRLFGLADC
jgi:hypothetical protein